MVIWSGRFVYGRQLTFAATDPFESHFSAPGESDLSPKIKVIEQNKWTMAREELPGGLRLVRSVPKVDESEASLLPALKDVVATAQVGGSHA